MRDQKNTLENIVEEQPTSAFICDDKGQILAVNNGGQDNLAVSVGDRVYDLPFDVKTAKQLKKLLNGNHAHGNIGVKSFALRDLNHDQQSQQSLVLIVQALPISDQLGYHFLFTSSLATWHPGIEQVLSSAFELTPAEIEVVKQFELGALSKKKSQS